MTESIFTEIMRLCVYRCCVLFRLLHIAHCTTDLSWHTLTRPFCLRSANGLGPVRRHSEKNPTQSTHGR